MLTVEHLRTLSPTEFKILAYLNLTTPSVTMTQQELADAIGCNQRSIRRALRDLEARGLVKYKVRSTATGKSTLTLQ